MISAFSDITTSSSLRVGFSWVFVRVCQINLATCSCQVHHDTYKVPTFILDSRQGVLANDSPYESVSIVRASRQLEIQQNFVLGIVTQVVQGPAICERNLEEVVPWEEAENGMERGNTSPTSCMLKHVRSTITNDSIGQSGSRELGFE